MRLDRLDRLYRHAADLGIEVEWADLGPTRRGEYRADAPSITLSTRLTRVQATSTLAHELAHHLYADRCTRPASERRAWEIGAALLVSVGDYADAERLVGCHVAALATELEVEPIVVEAWRRWYARTSGSVRADRVRALLLDRS